MRWLVTGLIGLLAVGFVGLSGVGGWLYWNRVELNGERAARAELGPLATKQVPAVLGYDFAQEEKGADYGTAGEILGSGMRVHRTILPRVVFQIENLINLDQIPSKVKVIALPAKWKTESAPARVVALVEE